MGLSTRRDGKLFVTIEGCKRELSTESCLGNRDRHVSNKIILFTFVPFVSRDSNVHIQVSGYSTTSTHRSALTQPQRCPSINTRWHLNLVGALSSDATLSTTSATRGCNDLTETRTPRTCRRRHHLTEHALSNTAHLAGTIAICAGHRLSAFTGTGTCAVIAPLGQTEIDRDFCAKDSLLKFEIEDNLHILASWRPRRTASTVTTAKWARAPKEGVENVAKAATAKDVFCRWASCPTDTCLAKSVIAGALIIIGKHLVRNS
jgi:hypothetical protein